HTNVETSSPQNVLPMLLFQGQHAPLAFQLPKQRATWPDKGQVRPAFSVPLNGGYPPAISSEGRPEMSGPNPVKAAHIKHRVQQVFLAHFRPADTRAHRPAPTPTKVGSETSLAESRFTTGEVT